MLKSLNRRWTGFAIHLAALLPLIGAAATAPPTAQELLAAQDKELVSGMLEWDKRLFSLPNELALDPPLLQAANEIAQAHLARVRTLWPAWIAQERAASGNPGMLTRNQLQSLYARSINELAIWSVESGGRAQDEAWLKAALATASCNAPSSPYFAQRIAMIQAAPMESRATLLAGERELLSRWGTKRQPLPPRPTMEELNAADQAIARLRAGRPVEAEPMSPGLAGRLFDRDRKPDRPNGGERWDKCAKGQWWLASQLAGGKVDKMKALTIYRYSTMAAASDYTPASVLQMAAAPRPSDGKQVFPPVAAFFGAHGVTTIEALTDGQGKFIKAKVVARKITVPGVYDNAPVAFEALFDAASLDYAEKGYKYPRSDDPTIRFELNWTLNEAANDVR